MRSGTRGLRWPCSVRVSARVKMTTPADGRWSWLDVGAHLRVFLSHQPAAGLVVEPQVLIEPEMLTGARMGHSTHLSTALSYGLS